MHTPVFIHFYQKTMSNVSSVAWSLHSRAREFEKTLKIDCTSSLVVFTKNAVPLLELFRKRSTQVPYTCRKCRKDHKNCTLISVFWKKKKRLFLIESPCSNYRVASFQPKIALRFHQPVPTSSFSPARSHQPTRFPEHGHPAVTSNWVQSPHVGAAAVQLGGSSLLFYHKHQGKTQAHRECAQKSENIQNRVKFNFF